MKLIPALSVLLITIPLIHSCGGSSGGGGDDDSQREEAPGGTTGGSGGTSGGTTGGTTGGSTGGSTGGTSGGTTGGTDTACVSALNRANIESVLLKMEQLKSVEGSYIGTERLEDSSEVTFNGSGFYNIEKGRVNEWNVSGGFCDPNICMDTLQTFQFKADGCFYANNMKARVVFTTVNQFIYRITNEVDNTEENSFSVTNGDLKSTESVFDDSGEISTFKFDAF